MCLERINQNLERLVGDDNVKAKLLIATFFAALCLPVAARADDAKVYSGSGCVPEQGAKLTEFVYPYGGVMNVGSSNATVNCLIVRDSTVSQAGGRKSLGEVRVRFNPGSNPDWNQLAGSACGVWAFGPFEAPPSGGQELVKYYNSVPLAAGVVSELKIDPPISFSFSSSSSSALGQYVLFCQLPPGAGIVSYLVIER